MKRVMWINLVLGVWLIISPFALRYGAASTVGAVAIANDVILGIVLVGSSWWILAAKAGQLGLSWLQVLCGVWLIIAPFLLQNRELSPTTINSLAVGIVVLIVSAIETWTLTRPRMRAA